MVNFFIRRPIVAIVIAILTVIVGAISIASLPVAQFPQIAPPEIRLQANYPGADAQTLEQAVATPIEQQVSGVDNMTYMYSLNATANQQTTLLVDFDLKTDPNMDLILTQSRQQLARLSVTHAVAFTKAVGHRQEQRDDGLLIFRIGFKHVQADAFRLRRLVEQTIALGFLQCRRDRFL